MVLAVMAVVGGQMFLYIIHLVNKLQYINLYVYNPSVIDAWSLGSYYFTSLK